MEKYQPEEAGKPIKAYVEPTITKPPRLYGETNWHEAYPRRILASDQLGRLFAMQSHDT